MIVEVDGGCTYEWARVVGKKHHTARSLETCWEEISEPQFAILRPCVSGVIGLSAKVETVDCDDTST